MHWMASLHRWSMLRCRRMMPRRADSTISVTVIVRLIVIVLVSMVRMVAMAASTGTVIMLMLPVLSVRRVVNRRRRWTMCLRHWHASRLRMIGMMPRPSSTRRWLGARFPLRTMRLLLVLIVHGFVLHNLPSNSSLAGSKDYDQCMSRSPRERYCKGKNGDCHCIQAVQALSELPFRHALDIVGLELENIDVF